MSELIIKAGQWDSFSSSAVESFLASIAILLGLTEKKKKFIEQIYKDIHGPYQPDHFYYDSLKIIGKWPPNMQLQNCIENCNDTQKKQLKIWYRDLLTLEPMEEINPFLQFMLPQLSNTIENF